ncbi:MAG: prepilin peptidase [Vicinamibacterales bacterium]
MQVWTVVLTVLVGIGAAVDVQKRRIPNVLTLGAAAAAVAYHSWVGGLTGLGHSLAGWGVGIGLFLPLFLLRGMGAGDVKFLGMAGAWLGPGAAVTTALYSTIAGAVLALLVGGWHGYLGKAFRNLWQLLLFWRTAGIQPLPGLTLQDGPGPRLPYGVAIAAGTIATIWLM